VFICHKSFLAPYDLFGIIQRMCFVSGVCMLIFVSFLLLFISSTFKTNNFAVEQCRNKKKKEVLSRKSFMTSLLGCISLITLVLSIVIDLTVTGLMWWTRFQLDKMFKVTGDCFCEINEDNSYFDYKNVFNIKCPEIEEFMCTSVYNAVMVNFMNVEVSTMECQKLSGKGFSEECLQYSTFWTLFKVLRIILPLLVAMKLPLMIGNFCSSKVKVHNKKKSKANEYVTDSDSWIGVEGIISPLKLFDPVHFYAGICAPVNECKQVLGERLGPIGQECEEDGSLPLKSQKGNQAMPSAVIPLSNKNSGNSFLDSPNSNFSTPLRFQHSTTKKVADTPPKERSQPNSESCAVISTPVNPNCNSTPNFDLSKVLKPQSTGVSNENRPKLSSFASCRGVDVNCIPSPPPIPKENLVLNHPHPPFLRSTLTLPRPVLRSDSSVGHYMPGSSRSSFAFRSNVKRPEDKCTKPQLDDDSLRC